MSRPLRASPNYHALFAGLHFRHDSSLHRLQDRTAITAIQAETIMTSQTVGVIALTSAMLGLIWTDAMAHPPTVRMQIDTSRGATDLQTRRYVVRFADLDLSSEAGVKTLYRRIRSAAESVCAPLGGARELARQAQWRACRDTAIADAVAEIDHPMLSQHYAMLTADNPGICARVTAWRKNSEDIRSVR
jgi:UrcA family protein